MMIILWIIRWEIFWKLVEAIINGNVEEAELAMSQHMETIEQYLDEIQKEQQQGRR